MKPPIDEIQASIARLRTKDRFRWMDSIHTLKESGAEGLRCFIAALRDADEFEGMYLLNAAVEIGSPVVPYLLQELASLSSTTRCYAVAALGEIGDPEGREGLRGVVQDPDPLVRLAVLQAMDKLDHRYFMRDIRDALNDTDLQVRGYAAGIVGSRQDRDAPPLLLLLCREEEAELRAVAARSLGKIGDLSAVPQLLRMTEDSAPMVASAALLALGDLRAPESFNAVTACLHASQDLVRCAAVKSLGRLRDRRAIALLRGMAEHHPEGMLAELIKDTLSFLENIPPEGEN